MAGTRVFPNALELRDAAARASLERIERDCARAPEKLRPLLGHIREQLFSPELNVQSLKRACAVRDNSVSTAFGQAIGLPPRPYIESRRLETAERLLSETAISVNEISRLVGFSSEAVFYRAFRRWRHMAPTAFRTAAQDKREPLAVDCLRTEDLRRALHGGATPDEAQALIAGLASAQSDGEAPPAADRAAAAAPAAPDSAAEALWDEIRDLDPRAQRARIRAIGALRTELAELLFERSRVEGRDNRKHGVHIAELAVFCLESGAPGLERIAQSDLATLRARAWAWLANAQRLALDLIEADKAIEVAKQLLPEEAPGEVVAEVLELEGALLYSAGRYGDAFKVLEEALDTSHEILSSKHCARIRLQKARVAIDLGRPLDSAASAQAALRDLALDEDPYLEAVAYHRLIGAFLNLDKPTESMAFVPAARRLTRLVKSKYLTNHQRWLEGQTWRSLGESLDAIPLLKLALDGFIESQESFYAALVALDLAVAFVELGDDDSAAQACSEAIPLLQVFGAHSEWLTAAGILRGLVKGRALTLEKLRSIRSHLETNGYQIT